MEVGRFMGYLHPALIHFPIVLLLVAVLLEGVEYFRPNPRLAWAVRLLLLLGVVSALFAFVCGNFAEIWAARSGISQDALEYHEFLATITSWLFVGLTAWRMMMRPAVHRFWRGTWLLGGVGACILLGLTGYHGASLVYEHGAAVQNIGLTRTPTHDDLATLAQRQDAASIAYSEMMHHVFGWMVLLLSVLVLLDYVSPRIAERARKFGPLLLLAGGLLLLIFSDQDAWPLYHIQPFRPITDKEVLLHKTYAVLMLLIGAWGIVHSFLSGRRAGPLDDYGWQSSGKVQSRLMAVFALVGGALLFTHVHSAAPYANVAVGVYIHHTVLGLIALSIGAVKLLDDFFSRVRWRTLAFPALMGLEAVFLINYNEGLPWFLGYGKFATVGTHGGSVSPLGPNSAELVYHPESQRLEVFVTRGSSAVPLPLDTPALTAVVRLGNAETEVQLPANPGSEQRSAHFASKIGFLRGVPSFEIAVRAPTGGREYVADFEPWIDRSLLPIASAPFICPMHPDVGAAGPGTCEKCGMPLAPRRPSRPKNLLHDPDLRMDLEAAPARILPGLPSRLLVAVRRASDGRIVSDLAVVHTKKLHLIVTSADLAFFDHVHPQPVPDGSLALDYIFPHPGDFLLFADVTPVGRANQVFRLPVHVDGTAPPQVPLRETQATAKLIGDYQVELITSPATLRAADETQLTFGLSLDGAPVMDIDLYLGALGHCVIISEDGRTYLHSHPAPSGAGRGPRVSFHTEFPHPGLFKVWGQFNHRGRILTTDFVVRVN